MISGHPDLIGGTVRRLDLMRTWQNGQIIPGRSAVDEPTPASDLDGYTGRIGSANDMTHEERAAWRGDGRGERYACAYCSFATDTTAHYEDHMASDIHPGYNRPPESTPSVDADYPPARQRFDPAVDAAEALALIDELDGITRETDRRRTNNVNQAIEFLNAAGRRLGDRPADWREPYVGGDGLTDGGTGIDGQLRRESW